MPVLSEAGCQLGRSLQITTPYLTAVVDGHLHLQLPQFTKFYHSEAYTRVNTTFINPLNSIGAKNHVVMLTENHGIERVRISILNCMSFSHSYKGITRIQLTIFTAKDPWAKI